MKNQVNDAVQTAIMKYIDSIDDKIIAGRTLEKIEKAHKTYTAEIYLELNPVCKKNDELRRFIAILKKKKPAKGTTKEEKINFYKGIIDELVIETKQVIDLRDSYYSFLNSIEYIKSWNKYEQWLNWAIEFGEDSYLATHIAKLTHSSSKGSSVDIRYHESCDKHNKYYVCTPSEPLLDTAYPDNKYSSISQLYNVSVGNTFIGDYLREGDPEFFTRCSQDEQLLKSWALGFSNLIKNEKKKSYFLSKQVYFPLGTDEYHLLLPLTSSSLVHALHLEHKKYWDESQEKARKQKSDKKYSDTVTKTFPNKAYIHVTGSNHSNASSLNGKRGGRISLLPAMPPVWKTNISNYAHKESIFDKTLAFELETEISELKNYLLVIKNKSLSIDQPKRNAAVYQKLKAIINQFFEHVDTINLNVFDDGWTEKSKLLEEHQMVFEPWREDDAAKKIKRNQDWQKKISQQFGDWLNRQLSKKGKLSLSPIQARLWRDCFALQLRERVAVQEVQL